MGTKIPVAPTRQIAIELGLSRYKANKPCKYGHMDDRQTMSGNCCKCDRTIYAQKKRSSAKKWTQKNMGRMLEKHYAIREKSRVKASNFRKPWTKDLIAVVIRKESDGTYAMSSDQLAEIMGRSRQAIEHIRNRNKPEEYVAPARSGKGNDIKINIKLDAIAKAMSIVDAIMDAKAALLNAGAVEPFTIMITSSQLEQIKASVGALRMIELRDSRRQILVAGMIVEVDDSATTVTARGTLT